MNTKTPLFGKTLAELQVLTATYGLPKFTAKQMAGWLYGKEISSIDEMTNLSKKAREVLNENHTFGLSEPVETKVSTDGTKNSDCMTSGRLRNQAPMSTQVAQPELYGMIVGAGVGRPMTMAPNTLGAFSPCRLMVVPRVGDVASRRG